MAVASSNYLQRFIDNINDLEKVVEPESCTDQEKVLQQSSFSATIVNVSSSIYYCL